MTREKIETVQGDRVVLLSFTLTDDEGTLLDRTTTEDPLVYLHGHDNLVPGLERALEGRAPGDRIQVTVQPDDGFGPKVDETEHILPRDAFPDDVELEPGFELALEEDGEEIPLWVVKFDDAQVVCSTNHPFAGKTLRFDVEVLRVREATQDELDHGHPHGIDGSEAHEHED
ncbi:MAG: peptidylprolyl isomerase [Sandaracinaceae bacterium]|nr:peptidylprolyl isomerase [Sandaracinaceae bacterium]